MLVFVVVKKVRAGLRMFSADEFLPGCAIAGAKAHLLLLAFIGPAEAVPWLQSLSNLNFSAACKPQLILLAFFGPEPRGHAAVPWLQSLSNLNFSAACKAQLILLAFIGPGPRGHPGVRCYKARSKSGCCAMQKQKVTPSCRVTP
jgi:hypothetical protein